nr:hypothetical protein [Tanacetum cinerariifolium]
MSKQCTKPRRKRDAEWIKDKVLLVQAQANGQVLQEKELEFLADPEVVQIVLWYLDSGCSKHMPEIALSSSILYRSFLARLNL